MIKSMTGYGASSAEAEGKSFNIEVKSVNHRYGDFSVKLPRTLNFLEEALRKRASERIKRGKVDIYVNVESTAEDICEVKVNEALALSYKNALTSLAQNIGVSCDLRADMFLRIPDVFTATMPENDTEKITEAALKALDGALDGHEAMRIAEGKKLENDLREHLSFIEKATEEVERISPETVSEYRAGLEERMKEILGSAQYDEARILTEAAIFADKINVNEETVRLKSHVAQFRQMLDSGDPVGRKIDFLIQEMNREINTIGSKSNNLEIARIVIDVKAEIEKLREQIQNVE